MKRESEMLLEPMTADARALIEATHQKVTETAKILGARAKSDPAVRETFTRWVGAKGNFLRAQLSKPEGESYLGQIQLLREAQKPYLKRLARLRRVRKSEQSAAFAWQTLVSLVLLAGFITLVAGLGFKAALALLFLAGLVALNVRTVPRALRNGVAEIVKDLEAFLSLLQIRKYDGQIRGIRQQMLLAAATNPQAVEMASAVEELGAKTYDLNASFGSAAEEKERSKKGTNV